MGTNRLLYLYSTFKRSGDISWRLHDEHRQ